MWFWIVVTLIILGIIVKRVWSSNRGQLIMIGIKMFSQFMESRKAMTDTCVIAGKCAEISYTYEGRPYKIFVPFNRRKVAKCLGRTVTVVGKESRMDITHQPGIPYFCSADAFGGDSLEITDPDGEIVRLSSAEVPSL